MFCRYLVRALKVVLPFYPSFFCLFIWISFPHRQFFIPTEICIFTDNFHACKLDSKEDLLSVIMDKPFTSVNISSSVPVPSISSVLVPSVSSVPAPSISSVPVASICSVPVVSVSMCTYSVNCVVPEDTDTEKVMDRCVTAITEETADVHSAQIKWCWADLCASQVSQAMWMAKSSLVDCKPGDNVAVPITLVDHGRGDPWNMLAVIVHRDLETRRLQNCR